MDGLNYPKIPDSFLKNNARGCGDENKKLLLFFRGGVWESGDNFRSLMGCVGGNEFLFCGGSCYRGGGLGSVGGKHKHLLRSCEGGGGLLAAGHQRPDRHKLHVT